jgi:hypothetical protein
VGSAQTRAALTATLLEDAIAGVRFAALPGASAAQQDAVVASLPEAERSRVEAELAKSTRSETLMMRAAGSDVADAVAAAVAVAENPAITRSVQQRLMARLPDAATRPRVTFLDDPEASARLAVGDAVIGELVQNPNATAETLLAAANYCRIINGDALFCTSLRERRDLAADLLEILDDGTGRSDEWAGMVLQSQYATRAQVERAVPHYYCGDREILGAVHSLLTVPDGTWWNALATSTHGRLRAIAAANAATPPSALVTLLDDPEDDVRNLAAGNPSIPLEAVHTIRANSSWILANPTLPDTFLHRLLEHALRGHDHDTVYACKKVLAARALRPAP